MVSRSIVPLPGEIWKDIPWTHGVYQVSNKGRVRRTEGYRSHNRCFIKTAKPDRYGYPCVWITTDGERKNASVHRLVAEAFIGKCPAELSVNHKDGVKSNNDENLEYVTQSENMRHAHRMGLCPKLSRSTGRRPASSASPYLGVRRQGGKYWVATIKLHGTKYYLGIFKTDHEAYRAFCIAKTVCDMVRDRAGFIREISNRVILSAPLPLTSPPTPLSLATPDAYPHPLKGIPASMQGSVFPGGEQ
jgi:hypothetical protein